MKTIPPCLLALALGTGAPSALAGDDCDTPVELWQPRAAVLRMADERGWQVQRLKIDDGCYEIRATDAQGRTFKARVDPQTLAIVKLKPHRERERERERERRRGND